MSLHVVEAGLYTLVVDFGRPRSRSLGVPVGGAADRSALALGNTLVGNPPDAAALEISLAGPTLRAGCELACVLFGAPFRLSSNRQRLAPGKTFTLAPGEVVHVGGAAAGARAYFCVRGGLKVPEVLGSRSGLEPLSAGAVLECSPANIRPRFLARTGNGVERTPLAAGPNLRQAPVTLRVVEGPQADWFAPAEFYSQTYAVTPAGNRMGLRLSARPLTLPERELVSEPVCPGAVQVTRDGQCIILGVDGQTIGGYPKVAQVICADLDLLGQLRPGEQVAFARVGLDEANRIRTERQRELDHWIMRLRTSVGG